MTCKSIFLPVLLCAMVATVFLPSARADGTSIQATCPFADCGFFSAYTFSINSSGDVVGPAPVVGGWSTSLGGAYILTFTTAALVNSTQTYFYNSVLNFDAFVSMQSTYGAGGSLQITGPDGFTFLGTFTGGTYNLGGDYTAPDGLFQAESLNMNFTGSSNNGQNWFGNLSLLEFVDTGSEDGGFTMQATPEPASLLLLGTGLLGALGAARRKLRG